jgi:hypothetical protein
VKIRLLDPKIEQIVDRILSGESPPETDNKEVIQELARRCKEDGVLIEFYRWESFTSAQTGAPGPRKVDYSEGMVKCFADGDHWPEPRPIGSLQPEDFMALHSGQLARIH